MSDKEQIEPSSVRRSRQVLESCRGYLTVDDKDDKPVRYRHSVTCVDPAALVKHVKFEFWSFLTSAKDTVARYDKVEADCPNPGPTCEVPSIPLHLPLGHSQWIKMCASYSGLMYHGGAVAFAQSNQQCSGKFVVNRNVVRYPRVAVPGVTDWKEVPFPDWPMKNCTGLQGVGDCEARIGSKSFRGRTLNAYAKRGWLPPANVTVKNGNGYEAHHVKPLQWNGTNDGLNGVLLKPSDHSRFNHWWDSFDMSQTT